MSYTATHISKPPLRPWAPGDSYVDHVSKPDESRWKHAKAEPKALPADVIQEALPLEREYYEHQRKRGYEVGMLFNGINEFFRGYRMARERQREANATKSSDEAVKS